MNDKDIAKYIALIIFSFPVLTIMLNMSGVHYWMWQYWAIEIYVFIVIVLCSMI